MREFVIRMHSVSRTLKAAAQAFLICLLAAAIPVHAQSAPSAKRGIIETRAPQEWADRMVIKDAVTKAMDHRDFAALDAMEQDLRSRRIRTASGLWTLSTFYDWFAEKAYTDDSANAGCRKDPILFAQAWASVSPEKPGPVIAQAAALATYGDCVRGEGYGNQIPAERMAIYNDSARAAYRLLVKHKDIASIDPHYYKVMAELYRMLGLDRAAMSALLEEASRKEPYYYETYLAAALYYYPEWYGQPGDLGGLAKLAADRTPEEGRSGYARLFWYTAACGCAYPSPAEWEIMKPAMMDIIKFYPGDWNAEGLARVSCKMRDAESTRRFFGMVQSDTAQQWLSQQEHDACRALAGLSLQNR